MQGILLAVVEGLTEYLPVSSTGHIILTSWLMGIESESFVKDYTIMVQFGAILAVVVLYWRRLILNRKIWPSVFIAFLPAAVIGVLVKKKIDLLLDSVVVVAVSLIVGGIVLIWTDHWLKSRKAKYKGPEEWPAKNAVMVGLFQVLAFIPGVSRAAATILGGVHQGLNLVSATEFSFFLAVPTLTGATFIKAVKIWPTVTPDQVSLLIWGNVVSFIVGALAIHTFVRFIGRYGLQVFGYYRIVLGAAVLFVALKG